MIKFAAFLTLFVAFGAVSHAQNTRGTLAEIKVMTKVFVEAPAIERKRIIARIDGKHGLTVVDAPDEADFFLEYTLVSDQRVGFINMATGQIDVYLLNGEKRRIVWSEGKTDGAFGGAVANSLAGRFLKDLRKLKTTK